MPREPFNPMNTAAMRAARERAAQPVAPEPSLPGGTADRPLSVRQVNGIVAAALTTALPTQFYIGGEISNFRTYDRGHAFFTLKEAGAELPCVLWKESLGRLKFRPKDGMAVIARGAVKLYEPQGKLQLYVESLVPQGAGALEVAFRQLCDKLRAEGLFEAARKRPIPKFIQRIAIITSRTGDVLHDVLTTAHRRHPGLHVLLFPVRVQGENAAGEIARAIEAINAHQLKIEKGPAKIDLILLVRGGGSLEDLWAFNEEIVARAICASVLPIATGIGHEPDTTIADLVGDLRGPTPTGITELTIPDVGALLRGIDNLAALLTRDIRRRVDAERNRLERRAGEIIGAVNAAAAGTHRRLEALARLIARIEPRHAIAQGWRRVEESQRRLDKSAAARVRNSAERVERLTRRLERLNLEDRVARQRERLDGLAKVLAAAISRQVTRHAERVSGLTAQLRSVSPQGVLDRGFSLTTDAAGRILRSADAVKKGDLINTRLADGSITSTVGKPKQSSLF